MFSHLRCYSGTSLVQTPVFFTVLPLCRHGAGRCPGDAGCTMVLSRCFLVLKIIVTGKNHGDTRVNRDATGPNWVQHGQSIKASRPQFIIPGLCLKSPVSSHSSRLIMVESRWCHGLPQFFTFLPVHPSSS